MRAVTGAPIKLVGVGESWTRWRFPPRPRAGRILGMGDVVSLVEKAAETIDAEKAQAMAKRMEQGSFTLDDLAEQLRQMQRIGGMKGVLSACCRASAKIKNAIDQAGSTKIFLRQRDDLVDDQGTGQARDHQQVAPQAHRQGAGVDVADLNKLLKMHRQMADMMKDLKGQKGRPRRALRHGRRHAADAARRSSRFAAGFGRK